MIERKKDYCLKADEICFNEDSITGIPSDDPQNSIKLDISFDIGIGGGDIYLAMTEMYPMRFRTLNGGGTIPFINEELLFLIKSLKNIDKQTSDLEYTANSQNDQIKSISNISIGRNSDEFKLIIEGIEADDQDGKPSRFMDIRVKNNEDVILVFRNTIFDQNNEMEFKTKENGGQFPIVAKVFTRIAERIANAEKAESFFD